MKLSTIFVMLKIEVETLVSTIQMKIWKTINLYINRKATIFLADLCMNVCLIQVE